ncbi:hypothetical protein AcV5_004629 [Taiwanofungus camphoratus]|nr:hypothetical protein AcW2_000769 [Antrodia cinnamomea]KAI0936512.1 hypothetical protein AcV5_004629 [Antrodia cinnamomea]KAI0961727.1 hypothetical protein AcV7_000749 [Antrodia cinnamomea]
MSVDPAGLPDGWVQEYDQRTQHPFWVDTKAKPPRAIWVHPFEDEQFLREHPGIRDKLATARNRRASSDRPPPYSPRRHSFSGSSSSYVTSDGMSHEARNSTSHLGTHAGASGKRRSFLGKMKDKAIGTKEEREAAKRQHAAMQRQMQEQRRQQLEEQRELQRVSMPSRRSYDYGQQTYRPPLGDPYGYGRGGFGGGSFGGGGFGGSGFGGGGFGNRRFGGGGGGLGGVGLPLLGGLAGGLLLGEVLDDFGGFGDPGWGGGGFDGGGFGDGGFGGSNFF